MTIYDDAVVDLEFVRPREAVVKFCNWQFSLHLKRICTCISQNIMPSFNHSLLLQTTRRPKLSNEEYLSCDLQLYWILFSCMEIFVSGLANAFKITVVFGRKKAEELRPAVSILVQQWDFSLWYERSREFIVQRHKLLETSWIKRRHVAQPTEIH